MVSSFMKEMSKRDDWPDQEDLFVLLCALADPAAFRILAA